MNPQVSTQIRQANNLIWKMQSGALFGRDLFNYHVDFASIASGAQLSQPVTIQTDSHFLCHAINFVCFDLTTHARVTDPDSTLQISDTGAGANWFDAALQLVTVAGDAKLPGILQPPRLVKPGATLSALISNTVSTNAQKYQLVFIGEKIYDFTNS